MLNYNINFNWILILVYLKIFKNLKPKLKKLQLGKLISYSKF